MRSLLTWWYFIALPQSGQDTTPAERERTRYRRLTASFTLLLLIVIAAFLPFLLSPRYIGQPTSIIAVLSFICCVAAFFLNKFGQHIVAATLLVLAASANTFGAFLTFPLDTINLPALGLLVIPLILAGSLMPPVAALIDAFINCAFIFLVGQFQTQDPKYTFIITHGFYFMAVLLPIALQIVVAFVVYAIMTNLIAAVRRADRAEEIVELQKSIAEFERSQTANQQNLEEGITVIAQVHAEVAKGNLNVRVPLGSENALWQIAVPLNNLLSRIQQWKSNSDQWEWTQAALTHATQEMQNARQHQRPPFFQKRTGTAVDPLMAEINQLFRQALSQPRSPSSHLSQD